MIHVSDENRDNIFAYVYKNGGTPIRTAEQMRSLYPNKVSSLGTADAEWNYKDMSDDEITLVKHLLSFGGVRVCIPGAEEDAKNILQRGQLWFGDHSVYKKGLPNRCHANSGALWHANRSRKLDGSYRMELALATGYALSDDGLWRQHSWCVLRKPRSVTIVETTTKRELYFGFLLNADESYEFVFNNPMY